MMTVFLLLLILSKTCLANNINHFFDEINKDVVKFNAIAADIAWQSSVNPGNTELPGKAAKYQKERIIWQENVCAKLSAFEYDQLLNTSQERQTYLLCRGPKFTYDEARKVSNLYEELQTIYSEAEVCIPKTKNNSEIALHEIEGDIIRYLSNVKKYLNLENTTESLVLAAKMVSIGSLKKYGLYCLKGENDIDRMMSYSRNNDVLKWLWLVWREKMTPMRTVYRQLVDVENMAARRNGYADIGASWRDEMEIPNLRQLCRRLYNTVRPLYALLHGVVRFFLRLEYGAMVPARGTIPAHLLGNLWAQNWEALADLIVAKTINFNEKFRELNWTVNHMVKRAEDYYESLGLPAMTDTFWRESVFAREKHAATRCHGTAADMFKDGDYRLLYCSGKSFEDFYVLHHEMGHIQYYMAYETQPGVFRQANTALHETIGDTIMYGVMTPQHLNRLGLINDSLLYSSDVDVTVPSTVDASDLKFQQVPISTDDVIMLKQALNKLPQIPFSLLMDEYRWKYFEGGLQDINKEFWDMSEWLMGVSPPEARGEQYFDAGAKFHLPDNTPFIRYFLSSFLQHQLFQHLCKAAVFGRRNVEEGIPITISMNRCDIYGSKAVGKILKDLMSRGSSQHWQQILQETIGESDISAVALKRYYRPLYKLLNRLVRAYNIPIGW